MKPGLDAEGKIDATMQQLTYKMVAKSETSDCKRHGRRPNSGQENASNNLGVRPQEKTARDDASD